MTPDFKISLPTNYVGCYQIGTENDGFYIFLRKRPKWLHRKMAYFFFGFKWIDQ